MRGEAGAASKSRCPVGGLEPEGPTWAQCPEGQMHVNFVILIVPNFFLKGKRRLVGGEQGSVTPTWGPAASAPPPAPGRAPGFSSPSSSTPPQRGVVCVLRTLLLGFKSSVFNISNPTEKTFCRVFLFPTCEGRPTFPMEGRGYNPGCFTLFRDEPAPRRRSEKLQE